MANNQTKPPIRIAITGAAGQIAYSLLFRIASGNLLGPDQPVCLQLLDIPQAMTALKGVVMELEDCAFPLLSQISISDDPQLAFGEVQIAFLVGARPRSKGMERRDLLESNGAIFTAQGKALNAVASRDVKVLVVGNPANTNAYIAMRNAPDISPSNFTSMMRLDHNRAVSQVAMKLHRPLASVYKMAVWGNHSASQYPDLFNAELDGKKLAPLINDQKWIENDFIPTVQKRGAAVIDARGLSSAASAANAAIDHMRDWIAGSRSGDWVTMGVVSDGSYGVPEGIICGFPVTCSGGQHAIVKGLEINQFGKERIKLTVNELLEERDAVKHLVN